MTIYEMGKYWLMIQLKEYRDTPPEAAGRKFVDWVLDSSRREAGSDAEEKKLHNLVILRYITGTKPPKARVCKALHIARASYENVTEKAIDRLLVLAFGVNGIDWNGSDGTE